MGVVRGMNAFADEGFDFLRWMHEFDTESRAQLDRFLDLTVEVRAYSAKMEAHGGFEPRSRRLTNRYRA
jgi:hypothetical protein